MLSRKLLFAVMFALTLAAGSIQAGDVARGQELAVDCADCHGDDGKGDEETPGLAGMDAAAFVEKMQGFKSGTIEDESGMMADYASDLSDEDMADLAAYYTSLAE